MELHCKKLELEAPCALAMIASRCSSPIGASVKKGDYKMLFRWQQYRADYCLAGNPAAGRIRTGVGLRLGANVGTMAYSRQRNLLPF